VNEKYNNALDATFVRNNEILVWHESVPPSLVNFTTYDSF